MGNPPAGSSTGTFSCVIGDDGGVEIIGCFGGLPPFSTPKPSPPGAPASYLLVHQFRLHIAWQLGDSAARRRLGGCVRDWKLGGREGGTKKKAGTVPGVLRFQEAWRKVAIFGLMRSSKSLPLLP